MLVIIKFRLYVPCNFVEVNCSSYFFNLLWEFCYSCLFSSTELERFTLLQCVVLDIEGTTTPISFVTDVMFPYARDNVRKHLTSTFYSEETKEDIKLLRVQVSMIK